MSHRHPFTRIANADACHFGHCLEHVRMARRPRITFVSRKWPPAVGGMETYAAKLAEALGQIADVLVVALPGRSNGDAPRPTSLLWFGVKAAARLLFQRRAPDVTHIADMASWPLLIFAALRRPTGVRVLSAHGTDVSFPLRGGVLGRLYAVYIKTGALLFPGTTVIANSGATAEATRSFGFRNILTVPLAAEVTRPLPEPHTRQLLFSGRLIPLKGLRWFVENVLPKLPDDITLKVAGTVWDDSEGQALDDLRVEFVGPLPQHDLWAAHARALCVVMPNISVSTGQFEGFGLVAVEAAAAGGVVLAARQGGLGDAVLDGETGYLLPAGDAEAWAAKIMEVASWDMATRQRFTECAQQACAQHFTWKRVARDTLNAYDLENTD